MTEGLPSRASRSARILLSSRTETCVRLCCQSQTFTDEDTRGQGGLRPGPAAPSSSTGLSAQNPDTRARCPQRGRHTAQTWLRKTFLRQPRTEASSVRSVADMKAFFQKKKSLILLLKPLRPDALPSASLARVLRARMPLSTGSLCTGTRPRGRCRPSVPSFANSDNNNSYLAGFLKERVS